MDTLRPEATKSQLISDQPTKVQSALMALADVDQRYSVEREHLLAWQGPGRARERLIAQLEARYRKDREALVRHVAHLYVRT
jgi:hypothetical protein